MLRWWTVSLLVSFTFLPLFVYSFQHTSPSSPSSSFRRVAGVLRWNNVGISNGKNSYHHHHHYHHYHYHYNRHFLKMHTMDESDMDSIRDNSWIISNMIVVFGNFLNVLDRSKQYLANTSAKNSGCV